MSTRKTLNTLLMPTKGTLSYAKIATKVNEWLRDQMDTGRELETQRISAENVRRIFEDLIAQPSRITLEALAAVQEVPLADLFEAVGYFIPTKNMGKFLTLVSEETNVSEESRELIQIAEFIIANKGLPDSDDPILKEQQTRLIQMMRQIHRTIRSEAEGDTTE